MILGAGRLTKDDPVDPGAGLILDVVTGDRVTVGQRLCTLYAATDELLEAGQERFIGAVRISSVPSEPVPLFHDVGT